MSRMWRAALGVFLGATGLIPLLAIADVENGKRLYLEHCVGCHGNDAEGGKGQGSDLTRSELLFRSDMEWADAIRSGQNMMPPYMGILNDIEIAEIVNYLRTLQQ